MTNQLKTYIHFSRRPLTLRSLYTTRDCEDFSQPDFKPVGLWLSDETCELSWSRIGSDMFGDESFDGQKAYEVVVDHHDGILLMSSVEELEAFTLRYVDDFSSFDDAAPAIRNILGGYHIRWSDVGAIYKGIIISPYVSAARHRSSARWYYTWDCASGCIWDPSCIREVRPVDFGIGAATASPGSCG